MYRAHKKERVSRTHMSRLLIACHPQTTQDQIHLITLDFQPALIIISQKDRAEKMIVLAGTGVCNGNKFSGKVFVFYSEANCDENESAVFGK